MSVSESEGVYVLQSRIGDHGTWTIEAVFEGFADCEEAADEIRENYQTKRRSITIQHNAEGCPTRFVPAGGEGE